MTSIYNFNPDGSISTKPENILIPNAKPRSGLHVKYLYPLIYKQMASNEKPDILVISSVPFAYDYLKLAKSANYQHNIPSHNGIPDVDQLNQVRFNSSDKAELTYYTLPYSDLKTADITYLIARRTILQLINHYIYLHMDNDKPLKVIIDDVNLHLLTELPSLLEYLMEYLAISLGKHIQPIIASNSDPRMMSHVLARNVTVIENLSEYLIDLALIRRLC